VQQSAHHRFGVVDRKPNAASQRVGRQYLAGYVPDLAVCHAYNYLFHLASFFAGLRYTAGLTYSSECETRVRLSAWPTKR
jgi:hypothetical protein